MSISTTIRKGAAWTTVSNVLGKLIIFANVFLILRSLSVYEYGLSQLVLSVVSTAGIFLLPGLSSAIVADLAVERARGNIAEMKGLFLQYVFFNVLLGTLLWAGLFFCAPFVAHAVGNLSITYFLRIVSFGFLIGPLRTAAVTLATLNLRFKDESFYGVVEEITKFGFLLLFFFSFHRTIDGLLLATVLSQFAAFVLYIPRTLSAYKEQRGVTAEGGHRFWTMLRAHRKWSVATSYINQLVQTAQLWIIRFMLGTEAVGLYSLASGIYSQVSSFLPLSDVLTPIVPRYVDKPKEMTRLVRTAAKAQFVLSLGLIVCTYIGTPVLMQLFPKYVPATPLLLIMVFALLPSAIITVYTPVFNALKKQFSYFFSIVFKFVCTILILPLSISLFGIIGVAVSALIVVSLNLIERTIRIRRYLPTFILTPLDFFTLDSTEKSLLRAWFKELREHGPLSILR